LAQPWRYEASRTKICDQHFAEVALSLQNIWDNLLNNNWTPVDSLWKFEPVTVRERPLVVEKETEDEEVSPRHIPKLTEEEIAGRDVGRDCGSAGDEVIPQIAGF
jgi:hypothetical protein